MSKFGATMNEAELEQVAGGMEFFYLKITGEYTDPVTGKHYKPGYLVTGEDLYTGKKIPTRWMTTEAFEKFKKLQMKRGDTFIEGELKPGSSEVNKKG